MVDLELSDEETKHIGQISLNKNRETKKTQKEYNTESGLT
jgi:hypothetical protein